MPHRREKAGFSRALAATEIQIKSNVSPHWHNYSNGAVPIHSSKCLFVAVCEFRRVGAVAGEMIETGSTLVIAHAHGHMSVDDMTARRLDKSQPMAHKLKI